MIWIKRIFGLLSAVVLLNTATFSDAAEISTPIARFHFVGASQLSSNTNAAKLKKIWNLPESAVAKSNLLQKMATAAAQILPPPAATNNQALIGGLLEDLLHYESILELGGDQVPGLNVAVQLDAARSAFWSSTLTTLSHRSSAKQEANWATPLSPGVQMKFDHRDKWTIVTIGSSPESEQFISDLRKNIPASLQKNNWLEGKINWARLEKTFGISIPFKFTETDIAMTGKADDLFTTVHAYFPEKIEWKSEPWQIPSTVRNPLVSFTAAQPLAVFCKPSKFFDQIGFNPLTRQFCFWAQSHLPLQTFVAIPTRNATNELSALAPKLFAAANPLLEQRHSGHLIWNAAGNTLVWTNAQIMSPFLKPYHDSSGEFIAGGLFPPAPLKSPPPQDLLNVINGHPKLVYYDWEITQNRIGHWDMLARVLPVFSPDKLTNAPGPVRMNRNSKSPSHLWIRAAAPLLGNTVTEVTLTGLKELTLKRKSHIGFTGMELIYLAGLADESDFPLFGHKWPGINSGKSK